MGKLALGTVQFGLEYGIANKTGRPSETEISKILSTADRGGINLLDTAAEYGACERILGATAGIHFDIVTKVGKIDEIGERNLRDLFLSSLRRLNRSSIYGLLLHTPQQLIGNKQLSERLLYCLQALKDEGLVQKIGVSIYSPVELEQVLEIFVPDIVQFPISAIDGRWKKSGLLGEMKTLGIERHARSVFLQGLLGLDANELPDWCLKYASFLSEWRGFCIENNMCLLEAALCAALHNPDLDKVLVGVEKLTQLEDLLKWSASPGINIPDYFLSLEDKILDVRKWG